VIDCNTTPAFTNADAADYDAWQHRSDNRMSDDDYAWAATYGHALDLSERITARAERAVADVQPRLMRTSRRCSKLWGLVYRVAMREECRGECWRVARLAMTLVRRRDAERDVNPWDRLADAVHAYPALPVVKPVTRPVARVDLSKFTAA
jgi:hypothetical protein